MKLLTRGDVDGFFVLSASALLDLILMRVLLVGFLGFREALFYERVLPAAATGLVVGNAFYAWQAIKLGRREGRVDATAMPFGTSALVAIVFVYLIMYPVQQQALANGMPKDAADLLSWHAGVIACFGCGLVEFVGAFVAQRLRAVVPRPALLVAIGVDRDSLSWGWTSSFAPLRFRSSAFRHSCWSWSCFVGGARLRGGIPGGVLIVALGVALSAMSTWMGIGDRVHLEALNLSYVGIHLPLPVLHELDPFAALSSSIYMPVILPIGFIFPDPDRCRTSRRLRPPVMITTRSLCC